MEEKDIKELENFINDIEECGVNDCGKSLYKKGDRTALLKAALLEIRKLRNENEKLEDIRKWYFENTVGKAVSPEMLHKILRQDYVSKDKIRDKIKELEENPNNPYQKVMASQIDASLISCLKELLGE